MAEEKMIELTVKEGGVDSNKWVLLSDKRAGDGSACQIWLSPGKRTMNVCVATSNATGIEVKKFPYQGGTGRAAADAYQAELMKVHGKVAVKVADKAAEKPAAETKQKK